MKNTTMSKNPAKSLPSANVFAPSYYLKNIVLISRQKKKKWEIILSSSPNIYWLPFCFQAASVVGWNMDLELTMLSHCQNYSGKVQ